MKPTLNPFQAEEEGDAAPAASSSGEKAEQLPLSSQLWRKNGHCPTGTIPIRRVQKHHLHNSPSIENYGKKNRQGVEKYDIRSLNRSYSIGAEALQSNSFLVASGYTYIGAKGQLNVWNPRVEANDEYSSAQISLRNGPYNSSNEIDFGWIVNPSVYGDKRTRLFTYWTSDSGRSTGCFDLLCSGFIQVSSEVTFGSVISPISSKFGKQYYIDLYVFKDFNTDGNWWLVWRNNTLVGYWPSRIFADDFYVATLAMFGGDVYSPRMKQSPHTTTAMGSGQFSSGHWGAAAYIGRPRVLDFSLNLKYPDPAQPISLQRNCYSAENYAKQLFTEPLFFYGGPGKNMYCL